MTGSERRNAIINQIRSSSAPVPGKSLAASYDVSRQVIVQDIALIRAAGYEIISTNRGYILSEPCTVSRTFKVRHTDSQPQRYMIRALEFYSGIGGLHLALKRSGIDVEVVRAYDWDPLACSVYSENHGTGIAHKVATTTS